MEKPAKSMKRVALVLSVFFILGAAGLWAPARTLAAKAQNELAAGYVDKQRVFAGYAGLQDVLKRVQAARDEAQKDYDANAKDLPQQEKEAYSLKLSQQVAQQEAEMMKPVGEKIAAAIQAVAQEKGLTMIIDAAAVVFGGTDITDDVIKNVNK